MPTFVLCVSTRARRSLLERLPRKSLTNLLAYLRLSPQPPHCHALRFSRSGASSQVQRSIRPALQALANAWVRPAEEMAYKNAVSLNPGIAHLECEVMSHFRSFLSNVKQTNLIPLFNMLVRWRPSKVQFHLSKRNWYWHSKALMVMASLRVSATPGSRLHILRCFFSSLSRSHSL